MTTLHAFAKVNLSHRVRTSDFTGLHPVRSLGQSIDWADLLTAEPAEEDDFRVEGAGELAADVGNLAWRAIALLRAGATRPLSLVLEKAIPIAAGLGGGSADAAAGLVLVAGLLGLDAARARQAAPRLGADVPFCLTGGRLWMEGYGERLEPAPLSADFHLAVVVPPFELSTEAVYRCWDDLEGPQGPEVGGGALPPSLREHGPLANDLQPAAVSLRPELGDWIAELSKDWGGAVLMSGSGPALFGFFPGLDEATDALAVVRGARAVRAAAPIDRGWDGEAGGTLPPPPWGVV